MASAWIPVEAVIQKLRQFPKHLQCLFVQSSTVPAAIRPWYGILYPHCHSHVTTGITVYSCIALKEAFMNLESFS